MALLPIRYVHAWRNVKGRWDLMRFLAKWDPDYRKDVIITGLAWFLLVYSSLTLDDVYDIVAMCIEACIIMVELGGELSILPADYRPKHGGVLYTAELSTHIAYEELSYLMSAVQPAPVEDALGFANPILALGLCRESPLSSADVDDVLMTRETLPYVLDEEEKNFIRSRHQLRYIAIRVANRKQHTTNGVLVSFHDTADAIMNGQSVTVRKAFYFDGLLTVEAFRSRIFRNNIKGEKEVYTDLTTYFPVGQETADSGETRVRFLPDFYKRASHHIGITTLLVTENRRVGMLHVGSSNAVGANMVTLGGSGSFAWEDLAKAADSRDFRRAITVALAREMCEETGMDKWFDKVLPNTMVTGFFRWIDRSGLPEFIGVTRAGDVPFATGQAIDGDEVEKFGEVPVDLECLEDFHKVVKWLQDNRMRVALSSVMALHRMTVIASYNRPDATPLQKSIYKQVSDFLFAPSGPLDRSPARPYALENKKA